MTDINTSQEDDNFNEFDEYNDVDEVKTSFPDLGTVRLGHQVQNNSGTGTHPENLEYFVLDEQGKRVYGGMPKEIDIMFHTDNIHEIFKIAYMAWGKNQGLKCIGNGKKSRRLQEDGTWQNTPLCKCDWFSGKPKKCGGLQMRFDFIIPQVDLSGKYHLWTGSWHSMINIKSIVIFYAELFKKHGKSIAMVPFKLRRYEKESHPEIKGVRTKTINYPLQLSMPSNILGKYIDLSTLLGGVPNREVIEHKSKNKQPAIDNDLDWLENGEISKEHQTSKPAPTRKPPAQPSLLNDEEVYCGICKEVKLTPKVAEFSIKVFGKPACYECQKGMKKLKGN